MLSWQNLSIQAQTAIDCGSAELLAGKKYAILGPSGAGKSTFLKALAGFLPHESGEIYWNGSLICELPPAKRPISYLFQSHNLFMHLTLKENVALGVSPSLRLSIEEWDRVDALCEELGLAGSAGNLPRELSGGEAARAALARVILQSRDILLLDEAFTALGPAMVEKLHEIIEERFLSPAKMVLFVSHQLEDVFEWCDAILWLAAGQIHAPMSKKLFLLEPPLGVSDYFGKKLKQFRVVS